MFRFIAVSCLVAVCLGQNVDPKDAKILKEQRFNAGDGRAGSAFATEDGLIFREETDAKGNRIGQYSYIGADGQTYTVKYSAGVDGFRILSGDHIRATGADAAPFDPNFGEEQEEEILPQQLPVAALPQQQPQPQPAAAQPVDPNRNPFVNPHDPTHRNFQFNANAQTFETGVDGASVVPNCANCGGVNPFVNPFDASHTGVLAGHQAGFGAGQQQPLRPAAPAPTPALPRLITTTTPQPKRFFPPGSLKLNRFDTGFNFDFES